jgi:hypothetical protein
MGPFLGPLRASLRRDDRSHVLGNKSDMTAMLHTFRLFTRGPGGIWSRPTTTLSAHAHSGWRVEVPPPSLRCAPEGSVWQRLMFWLMAPAPQQVAPPLNRLPGVRLEFLGALADIEGEEVDALRLRIGHCRSLRELWHARAEVFRVVGVAHNQAVADTRLAALNRHFPTRAPRSQFAPLS